MMLRTRHWLACAQALLPLASGLLPRSLLAAPAGAPVVQVIELWEPNLDQKAQALTNSLRDVIFDANEFALNTDNPQLLPLAQDAKCDVRGFDGALVEASDRGMSKACLERLGKRLGAKGGYFWGYLYAGEGGRKMVKLHLWQQGEDRAIALAYDERDRKRLAERLYRHLVSPGKVGDARFVAEGGALRGELSINGLTRGAFDGAAVELTLPLGAVTAEVRSGDRVLARGEGAVTASGVATVRLMPVAAPSPPARVEPLAGARLSTTSAVEGPSVLPWVFGGVGVVGLAGAGLFYGLRQAERSDLEKACRSEKCPPSQQDAIDRGGQYGALSLVSLGVGVAGFGVATYLFLREGDARSTASRGPRVVGTVQPLAGGVSAGLVGSF
ncbi:MAG TPA: hypothetical protein VFS00_22950 [Polyangiaceae bacterium]|nr:hypothetical protein [Polyangiaceae bacterium]